MILLDTHTLMWYTHKQDYLSKTALNEIKRASAAIVYVSALTFWEIAIKVAKNKLEFAISVPAYRDDVMKLGFISILPVDEFIFMDAALMKFPNRDPADRMLVATAKRKNLKIVSCDPAIKKAWKKTVW